MKSYSRDSKKLMVCQNVLFSLGKEIRTLILEKQNTSKNKKQKN